MSRSPSALPIESSLAALRHALAETGTAVLQAPPGAGKTTRVPLALMDEPWLAGRRIVMLEPRRLAARAAARRMAETLDEAVGGTVGYRIRHETRVGPRTRVEIVTEGVLSRLMQSDAALDAYGLVIFDEFHERSVHADLGLALTLQSRAILRPDLGLLVMSATLDGAPVSALLGGAPIVTSEGRSHPVATLHRPLRPGMRVEAAVAATVREALATDEGDILAFLPGMAEIRRVEGLLAGVPADVLGLYGSLPQAQQDRVFQPTGRRKVVLATSIAETSLTIEGVRVVVDGGLARVPRYSPRTGMTRLATVRVSRASADQRRGRAGRQAPGVCYRIWNAHEEPTFLPHAVPEILETDLAPLALELAAAGVGSPGDLAWLDPPPAAALAQARSLLSQLGALDAAGQVTPHGRRLARFPLSPRLAHMVVRGRELGAGDTACELAALLGERDLLRPGDGRAEADLDLRLGVLRGTMERSDVDRGALWRVQEEARHCRRALERAGSGGRTEMSVGALLALAYPDRIGQRRPGEAGRYLLRNGQGAFLDPQPLSREGYLVAAELDGQARESRIYLAAPIGLPELELEFANEIVREDVLAWDEASRSLVGRWQRRLGALVLQEGPLLEPDPAEVARAMAEVVRGVGVDDLPWSEAARRTRDRLRFMHRLDRSWPDVSSEALTDQLDAWLAPRLVGIRRWAELERVDFGALLLDRLPWDRRAALEDWAPTHVEVPSGSRVPVDYSDPDAPVIAVRLQEVFGVTETPTVARGRVPLTLHLLSPARRPVQVTRDLAGFWRTTYFEVRKDLRGRYPKHSWPDDPLRAEPSRHPKRRGSGGT
jgi:ATP-dependent helicase HrpB